MDETHRGEELNEADRHIRDALRPTRIRLPEGGRVPLSDQWLTRLYAGDRIVREKKPLVIDHLRSNGALMVSVDDPAMVVIDGMSQTATFPDGFASAPVVARYTCGGFGDTLLHTGAVDEEAGAELAAALRDKTGFDHVSFGASGAEANEKALALCHQQHPERRRVVAFEGSFHGRTLLALHASYNPSKRAPYEIPGAEVSYVPFPVWLDPSHEPAIAADWLQRVHDEDWPDDDAEVASLKALADELRKGDVFAVIVEPMQSEGGDRYATSRFHRAVRVLTRRFDVPLIYDEVQTGFGLGGALCWHWRFGLQTLDGKPDRPDAITFAKRAQVGVVVSRFADPEPTAPHGASALRGLSHLSVIDADDAARVERASRERLQKLAARFPDLVAHPRACGYALAFDLPSAAHLAAYLKQRFWRGVVVFGAGERTVRYRLSRAFDEAAIDHVFDAVRASLKWLEAHPGEEPPAWQDIPPSPRAAVRATREASLRYRAASPEERDDVLDAFMAIEAKVYEPARRDTREWLGKAFDDPASIALLVEAEVEGAWVLVGATLGCPLETVHGPDGVDTDPMRPLNNSMYALSTAVDPDWGGFGIGKTMKIRLVEEAARLKRPDGSPRYHFMCGRMRVGATAAMRHINRSLGANVVERFDGQYGGAATALYYRMPLRRPVIVDVAERPRPTTIELGEVSAPMRRAPATLEHLQARGTLFGPAVNKLTLVNYVTPAVVRAVEHVSALTPDHPHLFLTSSRDECFDKSLRVLKHHRPEGDIAIGFEGGYLGHTSAAARSLSDPQVHRGGPCYFETFVRIPHPADDLDASRRALATYAGRADVLGLWAEPVQERTGKVVPDAFWDDFPDVPLVSVDTASAYYRSGDTAFAACGRPDLRVWYAGGQIGFVHVSDAYWVPKPLTMVSTWDGDELSLIRAHHRLRALSELREARGNEVDEALRTALEPLEHSVRGLGAIRVVSCGEDAERIVETLAREGFRTRALPHGAVIFAPPLDISLNHLDALRETLAEMT